MTRTGDIRFSKQPQKFRMRRQEGFTLIELLVVISIIGVLSTVAMTSLAAARTKARTAAVRTQMSNFTDAVVVAQGTQGKYLKDITNSTCTRCAGGCVGKDLRDIAVTDACYTTWLSALNKIEAATGGAISRLNVLSRDPWGSPYVFDENEGENSLNLCVHDMISSAGPNGVVGGGDDISFSLPFSNCP